MQKYKVLRYVLMGLAILAIKCDCKNDKPILDTDGDGIANVDDQCPNTLEGETVNEQGCSSLEANDFDRDGIPNNLDNCPRTPTPLEEGVIVNENGCLKEAIRTFPEGIVATDVPNQLIFSGFEDFTPQEIDSIRRVLDVDPVTIQKCSCDDKIQLWPLPEGVNPDNAIGQAKSKSGKKLSGDKNFIFNIVNEQADSGIILDQKIPPSIVNDPNNPIVAILDSGLDVAQLNFDGLQLLDTRDINQTINCIENTPGTISGFGWNFAESSADMSRDFTSHGTNVTKTFVRSLENTDLGEFQILPLKLFSDVEGSYWNVVCAFSYLNKLDSLGYDIALVNTSFGGQLESLRSNETNGQRNLLVLKELIDSLDETIIVASAGNNESNNDTTPYFPASYNSQKWFDSPSSNLITVGGHNRRNPPEIFKDVTWGSGSNYGTETVDLAAPWHFTILENGTKPYPPNQVVNGIELNGTSFSAPLVSAHLFEHYLDKGLKGEELKVDFLNSSNHIRLNASLNNLVKNNKYVD